MIVLANKNKEQEYRQSTALSQSLLKKVFSRGYDASYEEEPTKSMSKGSLLDALMFYSTDDVNSMYYVPHDDMILPSENIRKIIEEYYTLGVDSDEKLLEIIRNTGVYNNLKDNTVIAKVKKEFKYLDLLKEADGREIVSISDFTEVMTLQNTLINHPKTSKYFTKSEMFDIVYQVPVYFEYDGVKCKALLDGIIYDREANIAYFFDLKSTSDYPWYVYRSFVKYGYDIQLAFYRKAVASYGIVNLFADAGITIPQDVNEGNPVLIYASFTRPQTPAVLKLDNITLIDATFGVDNVVYEGKLLKVGKPGIEQMMTAYKYGLEHNEDYLNSFDELYINSNGIFNDGKKIY